MFCLFTVFWLLARPIHRELAPTANIALLTCDLRRLLLISAHRCVRTRESRGPGRAFLGLVRCAEHEKLFCEVGGNLAAGHRPVTAGDVKFQRLRVRQGRVRLSAQCAKSVG